MFHRTARPTFMFPAVAALLAAGCIGVAALLIAYSGDDESGAPATTSQSDVDLERFARAMPDGYPIVVESPREMEAVSDLVVSGVVANFDPGPVYYGESSDNPGAVTSTIMQVQVDDVVEGQLPAGASGDVWVELFGVDPKTAEDTGPVGQPTLLYLERLPSTGSVDEGVPVSDPTVGRPSGQPSFTPSRAQGFMVEAGDDVVQPAMRTMFPDAGLNEFLPWRDHFPEPAADEKVAQAG